MTFFSVFFFFFAIFPENCLLKYLLISWANSRQHHQATAWKAPPPSPLSTTAAVAATNNNSNSIIGISSSNRHHIVYKTETCEISVVLAVADALSHFIWCYLSFNDQTDTDVWWQGNVVAAAALITAVLWQIKELNIIIFLA